MNFPHFANMKSSSFLLRWFPKKKVQYLLPQPLRLFAPELFSEVPKVENGPLLTGRELFAKVTGYKGKRNVATYWKLLTEDQKKSFEEPTKDVVWNNWRIEKGYDEVAKSTDDYNPFYYLSLYPWEIVKDKLREEPEFSADVYDFLIREVFGLRALQLTPKAIHVNDQEVRKLEGSEQMQIPYEDLSSTELHALRERLRLRKDFYRRMSEKMNSPSVPGKSFHVFAKKHLLEYSGHMSERNKALADRWRHMSVDEKKPYQQEYSPSRRSFREESLQEKTDLVMDYVFEASEVEGFTGDWRAWRDRVSGDLHYSSKVMFPFIVERQHDQFQLVKPRIMKLRMKPSES